MQHLVFHEVGRYKGTGHPQSLGMIGGEPVKAFPLAREVMAAFGSQEAVKELDATDERNYEGYAAGFQKAEALLRSGADLSSRQLRVAGEWIRGMEGDAAPARLRSALGFWTWLRYNNLLYDKQSYTAILKGIPLMQPRDQAWIEPSPSLYLNLATQLESLKAVMPWQNLRGLAQTLRQCADIAKAEKSGALTPNQIEFLNGLDLAMLQFTGRTDSPIVVDVHTEPTSGLVLEEATGFPEPAEHALTGGKIAVGARFTHREFKQSMSHRLTDEEWLTMLEKEAVPKVPVAPRAITGRSPGIVILASMQAPTAHGEDFASLIAHGLDLMQRKQFEEARQVFEHAVSLAQTPRQAAQANARVGEALGEMGKVREAIEYLQRSLELFHYDQVDSELKQMRLRLFSTMQSSAEIELALKDQLASRRGTRVMPATPLMLKIQFDFDKATLTSEGRDQVSQLAEALRRIDIQNAVVRIVGHTDLIGTSDYNQRLSERRAAMVAEEIAQGRIVPRERLQAEGHGMREPLYPGTGPSESALNRRVEVMVIPDKH
jgi:outer membrane protein OmpA-like peptidoglycan-associated protein